jgi:type IV pilus assembly protein PilY1
MNGVYYNPNITYQTPLYADGVTEFPTPSFTNAWNNGIMRNRPVSPITQNSVITTTDANTRGNRNLSTARFCTSTNTNSGAGYYRYRDTAPALVTNALGRITNTGTLYTAANWEWVPLPASEQANFAIWWSYYHTRAMAAASAISRAFASFDENVRVAWQHLNSNQLGNSMLMYKFKDDPANNNVRQRFYNWLFLVPVSGGTPTLDATVRAGEFYKRGNGSFVGAQDGNPYWDRDLNRELSCRQNFHFNVSDGFWNQTPPGATSVVPRDTLPTTQTLPDGRIYNIADAETRIYNNEGTTAATRVSLADIAWEYWATNLRPDFALNASTRNKVPPFLPDRSTNLFGTPLGSGAAALDNKEIYWNPANDPASWSHMVNFMIGFGVDGTIPKSEENLLDLRNGVIEWPATQANVLQNVDDMWHAALNSRGRFFTAADPNQLIVALQEIVASILARRAGATATSVSLPLITDGTVGFSAGFDTSDWSGFLTRDRLDVASGDIVGIDWDAGCLLTGGACATTAQTGLTPRDPNSRQILTSNGTPGSGKPFRWSALSVLQRNRMNTDPLTLRLDLTPQVINSDTFGEQRVNYLRGVRTNETTATPRFRQRSSLLGAVIRGQPVYVSSPTTGHRDQFPTGSPEQVAAEAGSSYAKYQNDFRARRPMVYVASNNGMLHAFDAATGQERFAYVPNMLIDNYRLTRSTLFEGGLVPGVDDKPLQFDAFLNGQWKTVVAGAMRLGARGVYALDVTNPLSITEGSSNTVMWEFTHTPPGGLSAATDCQPGSRFCSSLGYTYESINMTRIKYNDKWVALVSSGYFPTDSLDPASKSAAASRTSLMVIDLQTGQLIREIRTSTAPQFGQAAKTFGLSQAIVYDFGNDQVADIAVAGDLAGNLWRFDLTSDNPTEWSVDLMFKSYGNGGALTVGDQPIAFSPLALRDPLTRGPIFIFGTGKFIGAPDRVASIPQQAFYGVRDYGSCLPGNPTACANYPISVNQLQTRVLTQDGNGVRSMPSGTANDTPISAAQRGWRIPLNIASEPGERAGDKAFPFFSANIALLRSIIPKGVDPCDPGARYGLFLVDGATGTPKLDAANPNSTLSRTVGAVISSSRPPGDPVSRRGGGLGAVSLVGLPPGLAQQVKDAFAAAFAKADDVWHRGSWRELQND